MTPKRNDKPKTRRGVATFTFEINKVPWAKWQLAEELLYRLNHKQWGPGWPRDFKIRRGSIDMDR